MEKHYDHRTGKEYTRIENSLNYSEVPSSEETENLIKEIYSNISLFKRLFYEISSV